jgi:hypothetical protein
MWSVGIMIFAGLVWVVLVNMTKKDMASNDAVPAVTH